LLFGGTIITLFNRAVWCVERPKPKGFGSRRRKRRATGNDTIRFLFALLLFCLKQIAGKLSLVILSTRKDKKICLFFNFFSKVIKNKQSPKKANVKLYLESRVFSVFKKACFKVFFTKKMSKRLICLHLFCQERIIVCISPYSAKLVLFFI
jgi:hypothetical protein